MNNLYKKQGTLILHEFLCIEENLIKDCGELL